MFLHPWVFVYWVTGPQHAIHQTWHMFEQSSEEQQIHRHRRVFCIVINIDKRVPSAYLVHSNQTPVPTVIVDNSVNIYMYNNRNMHKHVKPASTPKVVAAIGGQRNAPGRIGIDDEGTEHTYQVHEVRFLQSSPVNILDITAFSVKLNDGVTTGVGTR